VVAKGWTPELASQWQRIFRDVVAAGVGAFMLIWQTVFAMTPDPLIIGAGLVALGLPSALRLDERVRNGHQAAEKTEEEA
jgi:hypothetical protein